jgi:hypothetical protein
MSPSSSAFQSMFLHRPSITFINSHQVSKKTQPHTRTTVCWKRLAIRTDSTYLKVTMVRKNICELTSGQSFKKTNRVCLGSIKLHEYSMRDEVFTAHSPLDHATTNEVFAPCFMLRRHAPGTTCRPPTINQSACPHQHHSASVNNIPS